MTDDQAAPVQVRTIHVLNGTGISISTDGTTAMLQFDTPDGDPVAITFAIAGAVNLRSMVNEVVDMARRRDIRAGNVAPKYPDTTSVGHSDQIRGHVAVMFDPDTAIAAVYMVKDAVALEVAKAITDDVLSRATPQERARHQAGLSLRSGVASLILPHQR